MHDTGNWELVQSLRWGIPWMWNSGVPPAELLKGQTTGLIAGLDGDHVHGSPGGLWIEDEGWSVNWGQTSKHQTSSNMANRVLQFFAGGGAVHSYYMFFGAPATNHFSRFAKHSLGVAMTGRRIDRRREPVRQSELATQYDEWLQWADHVLRA